MRKLVLSMFLGLDGYISGPGGEFIGPEWSSDLDGWSDRMMERFDTLIYGRTSWERMAEFWPAAEANQELPEPTRRLASFMNHSRKILFSRTLADASSWSNSERAEDPLEHVIEREKSATGKDMVIFAGATTAQSALRADCVDEIWLLTLPDLFGHGQRLFEGHRLRRKLQLLEAKEMDTGAVLMRYEVL